MAKSKTPLGDVENWSESCFPPLSPLFPILCNLIYSQAVWYGWVRWNGGGMWVGIQRTPEHTLHGHDWLETEKASAECHHPGLLSGSDKLHIWVSSYFCSASLSRLLRNSHLFSMTLGNLWHILSPLPTTRQLTAPGQAFPMACCTYFSACT